MTLPYSQYVSNNVRGNYVAVNTNQISVPELSSVSGKFNTKQHVTLMYSKTTNIDPRIISYYLSRRNMVGEHLTVTGVDMFDSQESTDLCCLVFKVTNPKLQSIHEILNRIGCKHSYADFSPHLTIVYDCPKDQCQTFIDNEFHRYLGMQIVCGDFVNEGIKKDWSSTLNS